MSAAKSVRLERLSPYALDLIADLLRRQVCMEAGTYRMIALAVRNDGDVVDDLVSLNEERVKPYAQIEAGRIEMPDAACWSLVFAEDCPGDPARGFAALQREMRAQRN